jgi:uncharacterized protein (DUF779 family)
LGRGCNAFFAAAFFGLPVQEIAMVERVIATEAALALIAQLQAEHGPVMFHQSGGCCDNSAANCYLPTDLTIGAQDVLLGRVGGAPFYIGKSQYEYWKHTQLILDVIEGQGGTFSLEGSTGRAFHTRSRLFSDAEWSEVEPLVLRDLA